ncbi:hypothetical protein AVEN_267425-1 [Araneus ventricosus]|uniref:Uncharacterized protein n=1 Tax=Araneus ventricosus TaxID=182803 RepID=A0A4Y2WLK6_ARAVE|nr:hypothetical protein AVEN_66147-1 [Araneus ventricosus]GBO38385.1 hypothetical protein AVEN_267425-1 [Araneus ventricosus]
MQLHELFGGQLLIVFFHKLIDIIAIHLQSPDLGQRHDLVNYRIRRVTVSDSLMPNSTALSDPKRLPRRNEDSLGNPFPCIFYHFEAGNDVEMIFLIFSESKVVPRHHV